MAIGDIADEHFTYEARLASFLTPQPLSKRRASNASTKGGKSVKWPHRFLSGAELAKAGFFFHPLPSNPDNVVCFLCHKALDGWEEGDDPLAEHLKHSSDCGWAILAAVEKQVADFGLEHPSSSRMIEARQATFADKWPHESKKGWKCKVQQMVDAGWKYTPTPEYDDMATCVYCALALDGWENSDKPMDEHLKRSSDCPFFSLVNKRVKSPAPKRAKSKKERASKASRLSTQSAFTVASEAPEDLPAEEEDSILTTATNATMKRMGQAKKVPAAKGRKTRTKKGEPVEVEPEPEDDSVEMDEAPKPTRGRKRKSEERQLDEAPGIDTVPPPAKRRVTRTRGSTVLEDSMISVDEEPQNKPKGRKGRPSRKGSTASVAPTRAPMSIPDDEEIDRALEADLERQVTEDEGDLVAMAPVKKPRASRATTRAHSMFDAAPIDIDEATIDAELEAMEVSPRPLPKAKGAKGKQPRKVSAKQRAADRKAADDAAEAERRAQEEAEEASQQISAELEDSISMQRSSPVVEQKKQQPTALQAPKKASGRVTRGSVTSNVSMPEDSIDDHVDGSENDTDASVASQSTVVRGGPTKRGSTIRKGRGGIGGRKGLSRNIEEIVRKVQEPEESIPSTRNKRITHMKKVSVVEETYYSPAPELQVDELEPAEDEPATKILKAKPAKGKGRPRKISIEEPEAEAEIEDSILEEPVYREPTPTKASSPMRSPTPPPNEMTPSQSPQSSDAENHPPSSKPSALAPRTTTPNNARPRMPLSETTPMMSPSKRNIIAGLQSKQPWTSVDLETIFMKSPSAEKPVTDIFGGAVQKIKDGELTSPEKKMTVEEWIQHNAATAEEKLRSECERMVGLFESEGTRAMRALEGVECLE
ncbi:uncharacterized protein L3040_002006 [Drepanopeziza brunnea f. sp. 'multigermtubi']|uniref:AT hook domain-containing protein n=1 Tax=Marssonina brunnea f. sp. multigermtubi (strain MB_m1) TaxID=1072389 RepID=K1X378_MARBU|nr:AT hook domain-containing protein [Drepanopeziza brunnea f. sp. 'multigermtubi' MB_m1]EKD19651.1 AT hook domain-containing protein [Drepanopeziza brunnea f. sp. 'multigermtubi' MB_m1]KAJ5052252.1 hypothetical protein L3040_002006 [Drepanopeziza brunnea f. sp. 'multigermtubi']